MKINILSLLIFLTLVAYSITEVHIVGGVHPKMGLKYFIEVIKKIKKIL